MNKKIEFKKGYTFDDVLLVPQKSKILPKETVLRTRLTNTIELNIPINTANICNGAVRLIKINFEIFRNHFMYF